MRPELAETLAFLHRLAKRAGVAPLLFGTAVLELRGIGDFRAGDLDVIVDADEARRLAAAAGVDPGGESGNDTFRSLVHLHLDGAPLVIDVMAGMSIRTAGGWRLYEVEETAEIDVGGRRFRAASLADLGRFYRLAARAKDDAKIAALDAVSA
ncbi:hypothetical protein [Pleomorphomonas carboxyditropha]|uniref:Nucleotidyltransferase family protein n=1 Tax=Pleomorphomonas carboxyditropha TaxID=2023338 RepID=A0A2G9X1Z8_9HYPH|nr:hypothetical protein [Pleomorphomonas carboxyditropha]PIP00955.1 hypothetical protein CJ014_02350 [Pleomorphomonas carboxyditropha]